MQFTNVEEIRRVFGAIGQNIREKKVDVGRQHYLHSLAHGVCQAIHCGYDRITTVELGVGAGYGLRALCQSAYALQSAFDIKIDVYGFDNATGLPPSEGYRDHPELWSQGDFKLPDPKQLQQQLPDFAHLVIGDVGDTIGEFMAKQDGSSPLGFVSVDLDYYSSAKKAMKIFQGPAECYVPALPAYFDDVESFITYNPWCGEEKVIAEFNDENEFRKIHRKDFGIKQFYVCQILDHPIRQGKVKPVFPLEILPF